MSNCLEDLRHDLDQLAAIRQMAGVKDVWVDLNQLADAMTELVDELSDAAIRDFELNAVENYPPELRTRAIEHFREVFEDQKFFVRQWTSEYLRQRELQGN